MSPLGPPRRPAEDRRGLLQPWPWAGGGHANLLSDDFCVPMACPYPSCALLSQWLLTTLSLPYDCPLYNLIIALLGFLWGAGVIVRAKHPKGLSHRYTEIVIFSVSFQC